MFYSTGFNTRIASVMYTD